MVAVKERIAVSRQQSMETPADNRLVLYGVSWQSYESVLEAFAERRLRITYDRGGLEIMTLSPKHETVTDSLRRFIDILIEELELPFACYKSMTLKWQAKERGLEPDECYWFHSEAKIRNLEEYDFERDPPPELIVEVDITSSSLDRISIYEAFAVREVWHWSGEQVEFLILSKKKTLESRKKSAAFSGLSATELLPFLEMASSVGKAKMVREFRRWAKERIDAGKIRFGGKS